jgi:acylglycerol lipase
MITWISFYFLFFLLGVARKLVSSGFGVFALDYPGFGLSDGLHGYIPSYENLVNDVIEHFSKIKSKI